MWEGAEMPIDHQSHVQAASLKSVLAVLRQSSGVSKMAVPTDWEYPSYKSNLKR